MGKDFVLRAAYDDVDGDGKEDEPITVKGTREVDDGTGEDPGGYGAGFYPGFTGYDGDIGSGGSLTDPPDPNDCRDHNALGAKQDISNDSNHNHFEHGSIVYRDAAGAVHHTPPIEGATDHITVEAVESAMATYGISFSDVIGFVHNHPYDTYGGEPYLNSYPSGGTVPGGDWNAADWFVNNGAGGTGGQDFALYIIDPYGKMREYEYADRDAYKNLNYEQREQGEHLPGQVVNDGTSCG